MQGILEGLLYVQGDEGLTINQVMSILNLNEKEAKELIYNLKNYYENENRGLRIKFLERKEKEKPLSTKVTNKIEHKDYYEKLLDTSETGKLTGPALETLAIIAYNEPITRSKIDEMRGVDSIYIIRKLIAKGLIKEAGKSDLPGKPILYKTTDEFLDYFGLSTKDDLPDISSLEKDEEIPEEKDLFKSNYKEVGNNET